MVSKRKKKLIAAIAATIAGVGVLLSGASVEADDFTGNTTDSIGNKNIAVIKAAVREKEKEPFINRVPVFLRSALSFVLWALGTLMAKVLDLILKVTLLPVVRFLLVWLVLSLVLLVIIVLFIRMLYPEWPLRKIITGKLVFKTGLGSLIIMLTDLLLSHVWNGYNEYKYLAIFIMGVIVITVVMYPYLKKKIDEPLIVYDGIEC